LPPSRSFLAIFAVKSYSAQMAAKKAVSSRRERIARAQTKRHHVRLGHTSAMASATAIPTETSTNRCEATIHAGRWCAINKTRLTVIAAKRYPPRNRSKAHRSPDRKIADAYTSPLLGKNVAIKRSQRSAQGSPRKALPCEGSGIDGGLNDHNRRDRRPIKLGKLQQAGQQQRRYCRYCGSCGVQEGAKRQPGIDHGLSDDGADRGWRK
jgi:hypothetical protein